MLYYRLIEEHLQDNRQILFDEKNALSFKQIHEKTAQYCAFFQTMGIKKGDRILVQGMSPLEMVFVLLACIAQGFVFVPVNSVLDKETFETIQKDCQPAIFLNAKTKLENTDKFVWQRERLPESTLVYIIYTSGTEGRPKGVVASQKQVLFCSDAINQRLEHTKKDRILCCLPLSFDYGLYQIFLSFLSEARLYLDYGDVIQRIPYLLNKWEITAFPTIPTVMNMLLSTGLLKQEEYQKLRYVSFTGEVLALSLIKKLESMCSTVRIVPMYGMTECKRVSVMPVGREDKIAAGSCGVPLDGIKVGLASVDWETGIGELIVEGPNVMEGYWNVPDDDSGVFSVNRQTKQRVLYTGDLFKIDEEGFLYFCGRKNGIIKIRGYRVSSLWVENILRTIDDIREVVVAGEPDPVTGEHLVIFVYTCRKDVRMQVMEIMRELPVYLQNYVLHIFNAPLPKNQNGKISLTGIRRIIGENSEILRE